MPRGYPNPSVTLVVPVKNEKAEILEKIVNETRTTFKGAVELSIVDDGSDTPAPFSKHRHDVSRGYGAALKTGIQGARTEWVVTMDGDGQHRIRDVARLIEATRDFPEVDMWVGDRRVVETSLRRAVGRRVLNGLAGAFAGRQIPDLNSGLRIFRRKAADGYSPILCDGFSFTTSITLSMVTDGYRVDWLPIKVTARPHGRSHVRLWRDGWITLRTILWIGMALRTRRIRALYRRVIHGRS